MDGSEVVLWLIPRIDLPSFCQEPVSLPHEVRFSSMHDQRQNQPNPRPELLPTWWFFESTCSANSCCCGPRSLSAALALLPRRAAGQALAAHLDFSEAVSFRLYHRSTESGRALYPAELAAAAAKLAEDLLDARRPNHALLAS